MKKKNLEAAKFFAVGTVFASSVALLVIFTLIVSGKMMPEKSGPSGTDERNPHIVVTDIPPSVGLDGPLDVLDSGGMLDIVVDSMYTVVHPGGDATFAANFNVSEIKGSLIEITSLKMDLFDGSICAQTLYASVKQSLGTNIISAGEKRNMRLDISYSSELAAKEKLSLLITVSWVDSEGKLGMATYTIENINDSTQISGESEAIDETRAE